MSIYLVTCCPPYSPVDAKLVAAKAKRDRSRHGTFIGDAVNPTADFTDNMWCRDRAEIEVSQVASRAVRE